MTQAKDTNPKDALAGNKVPLDLIPPTALAVGALGHLDGATKYGRWNWRATGVRASVYIGALHRHIAAWTNGEEDASDGVPHLGHALACLNILVDAQACGVLTDDRPPRFDFSSWLAAKVTPWVAKIRERYKDRPAPRHYTIADSVPDTTHDVRLIFDPRGENLGYALEDSKTVETCKAKFGNVSRFAPLPFHEQGESKQAPIPNRDTPPTVRSDVTKHPRIYLAGPMRGHPDLNFPAFHSAAKYLRDLGYDVISPAEQELKLGFDPAQGKGRDFTPAAAGWDMAQILDPNCDGIVLLDGWRESRGAKLEASVAHYAGKQIWRLLRFGSGSWQPPYKITLGEPSIQHGHVEA